MDVRQLRSFVALAQALNFTRAAEMVHVTQSTLSHQIAKLEAQTGKRLFTRGTRQVELTPEGDVLLSHAVRALAELDAAMLALSTDAEVSVSGELRVGATPTFGIAFLPECISRFHSTFPLVRVSVQEGSVDLIVKEVARGTIDLGICFMPPDLETLRFEPLVREELMLAVGLEHPLAHRKRVRMIELHGLKMGLAPVTSSTRRVLDDLLQTVGATPRIVVECNSIAVALALAARSDIATVLSEYAVSLNQSGQDDSDRVSNSRAHVWTALETERPEQSAGDQLRCPRSGIADGFTMASPAVSGLRQDRSPPMKLHAARKGRS